MLYLQESINKNMAPQSPPGAYFLYRNISPEIVYSDIILLQINICIFCSCVLQNLHNHTNINKMCIE